MSQKYLLAADTPPINAVQTEYDLQWQVKIFERSTFAQLQDDISRFNFGQQAERDALAQYQALIAGGSFGGTSTSTSPIYRNSVGEALGAGALGVGIAGGLFGGGGLFPGFLKG